MHAEGEANQIKSLDLYYGNNDSWEQAGPYV